MLDGVSPEAIQEISQSYSRDDWQGLLDYVRLERAKQGSTSHFIEYVFAPLLEDGDGFLPDHIHQLIEFVESCIRDTKNGVALLPRGSSKSTSVTTGWLSEFIAKNPHIRIGLISNTDTQAWAFSSAIRSVYESNERFYELYGNCVSKKKWTDAEWYHRESKWVDSKDRTLFARGVGGPIVSKRFDVVILDDILDEENTATAEQMEKTETWFWKTLKPCLTPKGVMIYIGTRWAEDDMADRLIRSTDDGGKGWRNLVIPALACDDEGELVYDEVGEPISYWPARWPVQKLLEEREDMGSALFGVAYMNDTRGLTKGNVFHKLAPEYYFTELPQGSYSIRMGVDLASSEKERADYTARVVTAEDDKGNFYVLSVYRDKRETHHAEFIKDGWDAYPNIDLVICENQQFQSTLIQEVLEDYPYIPIEGMPADRDKTLRARAVAAKYEGHKVYHHVSLKNSAFERELLSFPKGHDDMVDALGYSFDLTGAGFFFGSLNRRSTVRR